MSVKGGQVKKQNFTKDEKALIHSACVNERVIWRKAGKYMSRRVASAKEKLDRLKKSKHTHYDELCYNSEYRFWERAILTGKAETQIQRQLNSIKCAEERKQHNIARKEHWLKIAAIYQKKIELEDKAIAQRKSNLEAYRAKCERIKKRFGNTIRYEKKTKTR